MKTKIITFLKEELGPIGLLLAAIILSPLLVVGFIYSTIKSILNSRGYRLGFAIKRFIIYWLNVIYQIWEVIKYLLVSIAYIIDLFGNVFAGEMIRDYVTTEKTTYYKKGECTISMATGDIEERSRYKPEIMKSGGHRLIKFLNVFEKDHCKKALVLWQFRQIIKGKRNVRIF